MSRTLTVCVVCVLAALLLSPARGASLKDWLESARKDRRAIYPDSGREEEFLRERKHTKSPAMCGPSRPQYECNDGLMGVWLRMMQNPDYVD